MHREFKPEGSEQLLLNSVPPVHRVTVTTLGRPQEGDAGFHAHMPSLALRVLSFLCPFPLQAKDTLKYSHLLMTTNILVGAPHSLSTTILDLYTSLQEIPSLVRKAALQLFTVCCASLSHPPLRTSHLSLQFCYGRAQALPHLTGTDGKWPVLHCNAA